MIFGEHGTGDVTRATLYQSGLGLGVVIDGNELDLDPVAMTVTPDSSVATQDTGTGRVRVLWPGAGRTGTVDVTFEITPAERRDLERLCAPRAGRRTFSYGGRVYTTRAFKIDVSDADEQGRYETVELSFYAQLPSASPPPGFGSRLIPEVRFSQLDGEITDALDTPQGTLVQTRRGTWFQLGQGVTELGSAPILAAGVATRDAQTSVLYGFSGPDLVAYSVRGRLTFLRSVALDAGLQDLRVSAAGVECLIRDAQGLRAEFISLASGARGPADWLPPGQTHVALGENLGGSFVSDGVLISGACEPVPCGLPLYVKASADAALFMMPVAQGALLGSMTPGVIASVHPTSADGSVVTLRGSGEARVTHDPAVAFQSGAFVTRVISPFQVTRNGLSAWQPGFDTVFRYGGVIKVLGNRLVTRFGIYRSVQ